MYENFKGTLRIKKLKKKKNFKKELSISSNLVLIKKFVQNFLGERSYWIDTILLLLLIEIYYQKIIVLNYVFFLICIRSALIFLGGLYLCFFKNFVISVKESLKN